MRLGQAPNAGAPGGLRAACANSSSLAYQFIHLRSQTSDPSADLRDPLGGGRTAFAGSHLTAGAGLRANTGEAPCFCLRIANSPAEPIAVTPRRTPVLHHHLTEAKSPFLCGFRLLCAPRRTLFQGQFLFFALRSSWRSLRRQSLREAFGTPAQARFLASRLAIGIRPALTLALHFALSSGF